MRLIKAAGQWQCLYRAVDSSGETIDFLPPERRDAAASKPFLVNALAETASFARVINVASPVDMGRQTCSISPRVAARARLVTNLARRTAPELPRPLRRPRCASGSTLLVAAKPLSWRALFREQPETRFGSSPPPAPGGFSATNNGHAGTAGIRIAPTACGLRHLLAAIGMRECAATD